MTINALKSKAMFIGNTKLIAKLRVDSFPPIAVGGAALEITQEFKNLGILVTTTLNWNSQVTAICKKVYGGLYQLRRIAVDFPKNIRKQLAQSLLIPYFEYASLAYCDLNGEQMDKLQKTLNCIVRFVCRLKWDAHVTPSYIELGWLKIPERKKLSIAVMLFKILKFQKPVYLYNKFIFHSAVHNVPTRNAMTTLQIPVHNTILFSKSFLLQSINLYNTNSELFDLSKTVTAFRNEYKNLLLDRYSN
uniref:Uncharacterized protein n=2 Tax=Lygus hesperus TaxID=30085 RepID=A0A0K8SL20_LYGHE